MGQAEGASTPEAHRVESPEDLDALDELAVGQSAVNASHERVERCAVLGGSGGRDVLECGPAFVVPPHEHPDLPHAKRAVSIVEHLDLPGPVPGGLIARRHVSSLNQESQQASQEVLQVSLASASRGDRANVE